MFCFSWSRASAAAKRNLSGIIDKKSLSICNIPEEWKRHSGEMPDSMGVEDPVNWRKVKKFKSHAGGHQKNSS